MPFKSSLFVTFSRNKKRKPIRKPIAIPKETTQMDTQLYAPFTEYRSTTFPATSVPKYLPTPYVAKAISPCAELRSDAGAFSSTNSCPATKKNVKQNPCRGSTV